MNSKLFISPTVWANFKPEILGIMKMLRVAEDIKQTLLLVKGVYVNPVEIRNFYVDYPVLLIVFGFRFGHYKINNLEIL